MSSRQLGLLLVLLCGLTLTLAWVIERRQVLSLREELDAWALGLPEVFSRGNAAGSNDQDPVDRKQDPSSRRPPKPSTKATGETTDA